jgi:Family of unknown function (DUF6232)
MSDSGSSSESIVYQDGNSLVSTARTVVHGTTFATANITSVRVEERFHGTFVTLIGIVLALVGLGSLFGKTIGTGIVCLIIGALLTWLGSRMKQYYLVLHSASGEVRALQSGNPAVVKPIADAISQAIIMRG